MSGLKVTVPVALGPDQLHDTDVPESDYAAWASGTTYGSGDRCIKGHVVWESAQGSNANHDPEIDDGTWWLRVMSTNRWRMFDLEQVTATAQAASFFYEFDAGVAITSVHILGIADAESVRVRLTDPVAGVVYDSDDVPVGRVPRRADWWEYCFGDWLLVGEVHLNDVPIYPDARLRLDAAGGANLSIQTFLAGPRYEFGQGVFYGVRSGFESYSRITRDQWGSVSLRKGAYSKRLAFTLLVPPDALDEFSDFMADADARVLHWSVSDRWRSMQLVGFVQDCTPLMKSPAGIEVGIELKGMAIK